MSRRLPKSAPVYVSREVITSRAFLALSGKSPQVLMIFFTKRRMEKLKRPDGQGNRYRCVNNGQLVFPYREAERDYGITPRMFTHALDQNVGVGFLDITAQGGGLQGDRSLYALSERWRLYETPDFKSGDRPKGRRWTIPAAHKKVRGPAHKKVRAPTATAHEKARGSPRNRLPDRAQKGAHSKESTSALPQPAVVRDKSEAPSKKGDEDGGESQNVGL